MAACDIGIKKQGTAADYRTRIRLRSKEGTVRILKVIAALSLLAQAAAAAALLWHRPAR